MAFYKKVNFSQVYTLKILNNIIFFITLAKKAETAQTAMISELYTTSQHLHVLSNLAMIMSFVDETKRGYG